MYYYWQFRLKSATTSNFFLNTWGSWMPITSDDLEKLIAPHLLEISPQQIAFLTALLNDEATPSELLTLIKKNKIPLPTLIPALDVLSKNQILSSVRRRFA